MHPNTDDLHHQFVLWRLEKQLLEKEVPDGVSQAIRYIVLKYSPLFSENLQVQTKICNHRTVYLINSSSAVLDFIGGEVICGRVQNIKINAGLVIFARSNYSQALWIFTQEETSLFGIAR